MPRYCAVKICRNRRGSASSHDNKRISFYPFPLQDKSRLQKWMDNMKRQDWMPSRHQYLCSEHFTDNCFDIRWGIRYLKTTAIPTIFPFFQNEGEMNGATIRRSPKITKEALDGDFSPSGCEFPPSKRPLISTRTRNVQSSTKADNKEQAGSTQGSTSDSCHSAGEVGSIEQSAPCVRELSCESLDISSEGEARTDPSPALHLLPEKTGDKEHIVCISEDWEPGDEEHIVCVSEDWEPGDEEHIVCVSEDWELGDEEHISAYEHSYCKPDADKEQLWAKILSLNSKISELSHKEKSTVAKIQALETEIVLLKRDGAAFKEKQKVLEDCMATILL